MTFSISGFCDKTGMVGVAITTSSICVASRCPWVRSGVGAATTQNITDPSLGNLMLDNLEKGLNVQQSIDEVAKNHKYIDYRQLVLIDIKGNSASYTGSKTLGTNAVYQGEKCIAAGNLLSMTDVTVAMTDRFQSSNNKHLAERLLSALEAGVEAGGEVGPTHSAALLVSDTCAWPLVDLRVDWSEQPVSQLRQCWDMYLPQMDDYVTRALDPRNAPAYGVPGDL